MEVNRDVQSLGDPRMLEKIDKLFACNAGDYVNLPQIVVVGDQSSGKSSVLEGLIKMPLPRDSGLCTRFATQIVFRRFRVRSVIASIIPDTNSSSDRIDKLKAWKKELKSLNSQEFVGILSEVHDAMGLARKQDRTFKNGSIFSSDVLRLEISGPEQAHFSVIDVPGIFKNTSGGSTTKADMNLVQSMVRRYMENPRSAVLTVIPSNVDIDTQEIIELAAESDPDGRRTLGVLTKPDLIDRGAERAVVDLIEGRTHAKRLGWHLVRNPGQQQLGDPDMDRDELEKRFMRDVAPWKYLGKENLGIESLRQRLQGVLSGLVRREFPNVSFCRSLESYGVMIDHNQVRSEILSRLEVAHTRLKELGTERDTPEQQTVYLVQLATKYQQLVSNSVDAKYGRDEIFESDSNLRLATAVVIRNAHFARDMHVFGENYLFSTADSDTPLHDENTDDVLPPPPDWKATDDDVRSSKEGHSVRHYPDAPGIEDLKLTQGSVKIGDRAIAAWLQEVYESSRGFELGTFDWTILATTMKTQSTKWESITLGYVSDIISLIHGFVDKILGSICHEERVKDELLATLMDQLLQRYRDAIEQARLLLSMERTGNLMTLNHYFNSNLGKW